MSLSPNYRDEYYKLLQDCLFTVRDCRRYEEVCCKYTTLCESINARLKEADALCTDAERLIDKATGNIKADAAVAIKGAHLTVDQLVELATLYAEKQRFAATRGWDDDLLPHLHAVLAIAAYEEMEKAILAELGEEEGKAVIYTVKKEILSVEESCGMHFFGGQVSHLATLLRLKVLYPTAGNIRILDRDSVESEILQLSDGAGKRLQFEKIAQVRHKGNVYLELSPIDRLPTAQKLFYYRIASVKEGQILLLEEDKALCEELWDKIDKLIK